MSCFLKRQLLEKIEIYFSLYKRKIRPSYIKCKPFLFKFKEKKRQCLKMLSNNAPTEVSPCNMLYSNIVLPDACKSHLSYCTQIISFIFLDCF